MYASSVFCEEWITEMRNGHTRACITHEKTHFSWKWNKRAQHRCDRLRQTYMFLYDHAVDTTLSPFHGLFGEKNSTVYKWASEFHFSFSVSFSDRMSNLAETLLSQKLIAAFSISVYEMRSHRTAAKKAEASKNIKHLLMYRKTCESLLLIQLEQNIVRWSCGWWEFK